MQGILRLIVCAATLVYCSQTRGQVDPDPVLDSSPSLSQRSAAQASDWGALQEQAEAEKAAYEAQTAAAKAQTAMYEAQVAAAKLKYGGIPGQTAITGATTVDTGGGKPEAILLVSRSSRAAGVEIYTKIIDKLAGLDVNSRNLVILQSRSSLALYDAILFDAKFDEVNSALGVAQTKFAEARNYDSGDKPPKAAAAGSSGQHSRSAIPVAGALVDSVSKLASYFLTDYKVTPIAATFDPTAVTYALVNEIRSTPKKYGGKVIVPELFLTTDNKLIVEKLNSLSSKYTQAVGEQADSKARQSVLTEAKRGAEASRYAQADAAAAKAIVLYEALMASLSAASTDPKQDAFIVRLIKQYRIREALSNNSLVLLLEGDTAAQYYTKKNIWTFFGGPPVYTAGAVTVSFALIDHPTGGLLATGIVAKHGGYQSIRKVEALLKETP